MRVLIATALVAVFSFLVVQAAAQEPEPPELVIRARCLDLGTVSRLLYEDGQAPVVRGVINNGWLLNVWRSADGGRFAVVGTRGDGLTCMFSQGTDLETLIWVLPPSTPGI